MEKDNRQLIARSASFLKKNHNYKRWAQVMLLLAVIVLGGTLYSVMKPGRSQNYYRKVMKCNLEVHKHSGSCKKDGEYVCGYADYVVHSHNDDCYDESGNLVCKLDEVKEHKHSDDCYKTEKYLICDQEETKGHKHSGDCYKEEKGDLECGKSEHSHDGGCYQTDEEGNESMVCDKEEHSHSDHCYGTNKVLVCGQEEGEGSHKHGDECYEKEKILKCGKLENHKHSNSCFDGNRIVCGKMELLEHTHGKECFEEVQMSPEEVEQMNQEANKAASTNNQAAEATTEELAEEATTEAAEEATTEVAEEASTEELAEEATTEALPEEATTEVIFEEETTETIPADRYLVQTARTKNYEVTVNYGDSAEIPEEAVLKVSEIDRYTEPERWAEKQQEYEEQVGEGAEMKFLLNIGFYVGDEEIEPKDKVSISIKSLNPDGSYTNEEIQLVHFGSDGTEILNDKTVDEDGDIHYETSSFSDFAPITAGEPYLVAGSVGGGVQNSNNQISTLADDASFVVAGSDTYVKHSEIDASAIPDGEYVLINARATSTYVTPIVNTSSRLGKGDVSGATSGTITGSYYLWNIKHVSGNQYYIYATATDGKKYYMTIPEHGKAYLSTTAVAITISLFSSETDKVTLFQGSYGLNAWNGSADTGFGGYNNATDSGNSFYLFKQRPCSLTFDPTNGGQAIYTSDKPATEIKETIEAQIGEEITLPTTRANGDAWKVASGRYQVQLAGWYNVDEKKLYKPGDIYTVTGDTTFYADWVGTDASYNNGTSSGLGGKFTTLDTSSFIRTSLWDYNDLINAKYATATKKDAGTYTWAYSGGNNGFVSYDSNISGGTLGNLSSRNSNNSWTGSDGGIQHGLYSNMIAANLFDESTVGVHKVGDHCNYLFYQNPITASEYPGYFEYDSAKHAASYNKSDGRFYVYNNTQKVGNQSYGGFAPLNDESTSLAGSGKYTNYSYGMKTEIDFWLPSNSGAGSGNTLNINGKDYDMTFYFSGDDDVFVCVDGTPVLDIGGIHDKYEGQINFKTGQWTTSKSHNGGQTSGTNSFSAGKHTLTIYYFERGANASNCLIRFILKPAVRLGIQKKDGETSVNLKDAEFVLRRKLENSTYQYYSWNDTANAIQWIDGTADNIPQSADHLKTDKDGYISFDQLEKSSANTSYELVEVHPPSNYQISLGVIPFIIEGTGIYDSTGTEVLKVTLQTTDPGVQVDENNKMTITVSNERIKKLLKIRKTDNQGDNLAGAIFRLFEGGSISSSGKIVEDYSSITYYISDSDGYLYQATKSGSEYTKSSDNPEMNLKVGNTYYIQEISAPNGYRIDTTIIPIQVAESGITATGYDVTSSERKEGDLTITTYQFTIVNQMKDTALEIYKIDSTSNQKLAGAVFNIYREVPQGTEGSETLNVNGSNKIVKKVATKTTSQNGLIYIANALEQGNYYLVETTAPAGYNLLEGIVSFYVKVTTTVDEEGITTYQYEIRNITIPGYGGSGQAPVENFWSKDATTGKYTINIPNSSGYELPSTGSTGSTNIYLVGLAMILLAILVTLCGMEFNKRERKQ